MRDPADMSKEEHEYWESMADAEDAAESISVGGMAADLGMLNCDQARQCADELITSIGLNEVLRDEYEDVIDKHMAALLERETADLRSEIVRLREQLAERWTG